MTSNRNRINEGYGKRVLVIDDVGQLLLGFDQVRKITNACQGLPTRCAE